MKKPRRGSIDFYAVLSPEARAMGERLAKSPPLPVPPTARECFGRGLLAHGLPPDRRAMSPAHQLELVQRYPRLYRHADDRPVSSCEPFAREGFACGDGWFWIIDRLSAKLAADPNLVVSQLKEKMGLLTVYFEPGEPARPEIEAATDHALEEARAESRQTCEICGVPGVLATRGHTVGVRCAACELPPTAADQLARGLLPGGYPPSRKTMTPAHQLELIRRHPGLYRLATEPPASPHEPFALDAFAVGDGWYGIVERLSIVLAADPNLVAAQVKEKDGVLKFHFVHDPGVAAVGAASAESGRTCEICGEPGEIAARLRGWISVRCVRCESLDDMEEACRRLAKYAGSRELEAFAADGQAVDASMLALVHLGEGAASQSAERRARFSGVDWSRLESFRAMTGIAGAPSMTATEIWTFARDAAPALLEALR